MTQTTIEIEETITRDKPYVKCDGCDQEIESGDDSVEYVRKGTDKTSAEPIHFHTECLYELGALTTREYTWNDVSVFPYVLDGMDIAVAIFAGAMLSGALAIAVVGGGLFAAVVPAIVGLLAVWVTFSIGRSQAEDTIDRYQRMSRMDRIMRGPRRP